MNDSAAPKIDSRAGFDAALRWAFDQAFVRGARRITCVDPSFADWALNDALLIDGLTRWIRQPQRRLVLLAAHYEDMPRRHPRFVAWRADWAHAIDAWSPQDSAAAELPTLLLDDDDLVLRVSDRVHWRGRAEHDRRDARAWQDELDAVLQRSESAFPAYRLGL